MKGTWVVVLLVVTSTAGAAIQANESDCPVEIEASDEPGQELANVVGAQESVVAREIERRGFNATLANASNPDERATIVATEVERLDIRLANLATCQQALVAAREDGNLTAGEYRERVATLEPEIADAEERLDRAAAAANDLPPAVRMETDIGTERFENLTVRVADLETFIASPGQAIDSVDSGEVESMPTNPTPDDSTLEERAEPPTTNQGADVPDDTTTTRTPTETPTDTPTPTPAPDTPEEPDTTNEPEPTTGPPNEGDGADESEGDWPLGLSSDGGR